MSELTYRFGRVHLALTLGLIALLSSAGLGYLLARDMAQARGPAAVAPASGDTAAGPATTPTTTPGGTASAGGRPGAAAGAARPVPGNPSAANQEAIQGGEVTIGAVITQSGLGDETSVYHGLDAALKELNAAGGIHGARVNLEVLDDGTSPDRGTAALRRLVENDHVFALVGECAPLTDINAGPYVQQQAVPVFGACFTANDQYSNPQIFPLLPKPSTEGRNIANYLVRQMGARKPAVVSLAVNVLHDSYIGEEAALASNHCDMEEVPLTQATYDSVVLNEIQQGCDGVVLNLDPPRIIDWMQAAQRYGYRPKVVSLTGFDASVVQEGGSQAEGMVTYYGQYLPTVDTGQAAISHFTQVMRTYHPEDPNVNLALVGYMAGSQFGREMNAVRGTITRQAFINQLYAGSLDSGFTPPLRWQPQDREPVRDCRFYVLHAGAFQPASGWYPGSQG